MGERLQNLNGITTVKSISTRGPPEPVYNLEVQVKHTYYVADSVVLVHNGNDKCIKTDTHSADFHAKQSAYKTYETRQLASGKKPQGIRECSKSSGYDDGIAIHKANLRKSEIDQLSGCGLICLETFIVEFNQLVHRSKIVQVKQFDQLCFDDASYGNVWIKVEDLDDFGVKLPHEYKYEEDDVACLPISDRPDRNAILFELDHFFLGCNVIFHPNNKFRGIAYIRSSDKIPYHVDIFNEQGRCSLQDSSKEAYLGDILEAMSVLRIRATYPFILEFDDLTGKSSTIRYTFS